MSKTRIINYLVQYFHNIFKGQERSVKAKKQILFSIAIKGISIVVGFVFVPLILNYLDTERYGIWLTLSSIITWFSFFDIGLGNGLRNRLTEAIAKDNKILARTYISTTYAILGCIFGLIIMLFLIINPLLNWQKILNTSTVGTSELTIVSLFVFVFFILRFFFALIGTILSAHQRPAIKNTFGPLGNIISLCIIFFLTRTTEGSLINLAAVLSVVPVFVLIGATLFFFSRDYREYRPSIKYVDLSKSKDLLGLGVKFFYFQIASIIFFSTTNFLIAQFSNQESVAAYNIAYKYLFVPSMIQGIILMTFWSPVTDAYVRKDYDWIKRVLKKLNLLSLGLIITLVFLTIISPSIYKLWIGNSVNIEFILSLIIAIYLIQDIIIAPFTIFINGFGKLKLGIYVITGKLVIFIPLAYLLGKNYGAIGVVASMLFAQFPALIFEPMQVYKLINNKAHGIWNQ
ncbi:MAG: oligosaccharide flippase family protein [Bacteroidetes bacterium]|nr:oligosaccharide flippase family protein [Bacteroidota bacterium]